MVRRRVLTRGRAASLAIGAAALAVAGSVTTGAAKTLVVEPRTGATGVPVALSGDCDNEAVSVSVLGRTTGWYDVATVYVDDVLTPTAGRWSLETTMPPETALVSAQCGLTGPHSFAQAVIAPTDADHPTSSIRWAAPTPVDLVPSPLLLPPSYQLEAFTTEGEPVTVRALEGGAIDIEPPSTSPVIVVGWIEFGENAEANQVVSVHSWRIDVLGVPTAFAIDSPATVGKQAVRIGVAHESVNP